MLLFTLTLTLENDGSGEGLAWIGGPNKAEKTGSFLALGLTGTDFSLEEDDLDWF
jgi:hypothetical protein